MAIRFRFAPHKALSAVQWMLAEAHAHRLDLHTILKACYFADKHHLNAHGRPIFGASYRAMQYGPVPVEIYEMLKGEPYWLAELERDGYPWHLEGFRVARKTDEEPDTDHLSASDLEALRYGYRSSRSMTFDERTAATHGPDWQKAKLGWMDYADMLDEDNPQREEILEDLEEFGWRMVL